MPKLFNAKTGKSEVLPEDQLNQAILSGTHAYQKGQRINVVDEGGQASSFDASELPDALNQGYQIEGPKQTAVREYVEDNKGLKGTAKVAIGQFADEALMGIPEIIANKTMDPLEVAKKDALKKEHNIANNLAGVAGFGASMLYGGPIGKLAGVATRAGEKAIASRLAAAGVEAGSQTIAKSLARKITENAVKLGVEGTVFAAPTAITEAALGDPELAAETLLMNGLVGAGLGAAGSMVKGITKLGINKAGEAVLGKPNVVLDEAGNVLSQGNQGGMFGGLYKKKANASEIENAYATLGADVMEGSVSDSKFIQDLDSGLSKKVSAQGIARQEKWADVYDKMGAASRESLESAAPETAREAGDQAKQMIVDSIAAKNEPFKEGYAKLKEASDSIVIPDDQRLKLYDKMLKVAGDNRALGDELRPLIKQRGESILGYEKASDLEFASRALGDDITALHRSGQTQKMKVLQEVKSQVDDFAEKEIMRQARIIEKEGLPEAQSLAKQYIAEKDAIKKNYSQFKDFLSDVSSFAKTSEKGGAGTVAGRIEDVPSETLINRLFDAKDSAKLARFKEQFPDAFDIAAGFKKNEILRKATIDGRVHYGKLMGELDKFSPQVRELIFTPEQMQKLSAVNTVWRSIPKDINPSGTARGIEMNSFLNNSGPGLGGATVGGMIGGPIGAAVGAGVGFASNKALGSLKDQATEALLRSTRQSTEGLLLTEQAMKKTAKSMDLIPEKMQEMIKGSGRAIKNTSLGAIARFLGHEDDKRSRKEQFEEMSNKVAEFNANPAQSADRVSKLTTPLQKTGAPLTADQLTTKKALVARYLEDHMPKSPSINSPFKQVPWKPSDFELSQFERRVHALENPIGIVDDLANGTLTVEAVDAVKTVYPKVFQAIQDRIMQHFVDNPQNVPYQQRLKLSLLLDMPMDGDLQPQNISALQKNFAEVDESAPQATGGQMKLPSVETETQRVTGS